MFYVTDSHRFVVVCTNSDGTRSVVGTYHDAEPARLFAGDDTDLSVVETDNYGLSFLRSLDGPSQPVAPVSTNVW